MNPVGSRFRPSVKQLIDVLQILSHHGDKVDVSELTEIPGDISGKQLYGEVDKEPWKLLWNDNEWDLFDVADTGKKATYVVTRLQKMRKNDNKIARKAGNGTWTGQTQPMPFEKDSEEIAYMKSLSYLYSGPSSEAEDKSYYYLHEYYLSETYLEKIGAKFTDYVICRIIKDTSKRCRCGRNANNKRRRVNDFATSSGANKEDESYNPNTSSETLVYYNPSSEFPGNPSSFGLCANDHNLEIQDEPPPNNYYLYPSETLAYQEPPVYYNCSECPGNLSSCANDQNLEIQGNMVLQEPTPYNYYNSEFTQNLNPTGLWVKGYTLEIYPCYGSTIMAHHQECTSSVMMQHHQDSGKSVVTGAPAQPPPPPISNESSFEISSTNEDPDPIDFGMDWTFSEENPIMEQQPQPYYEGGNYDGISVEDFIQDQNYQDQQFSSYEMKSHQEENPNAMLENLAAHQEPLVGETSNQEMQEDAFELDPAEFMKMLQEDVLGVDAFLLDSGMWAEIVS